MKVLVRAYSVFRDALGESLEVEFDRQISIGDLLLFLKRKYKLPENIRPVVIIGNRVVGEDYIIDADTTVHIAPPFSGGSTLIDVRILSGNERIDFNELFHRMAHLDPEQGALTAFIGFVKGRVGCSEVYELEYSAISEVALDQLKSIAREEAERHKLKAVVIWHYIGALKPGDISVVIAVVAPTRSCAISGLGSILERVKKEVPIFKLERRSNGEYWVVGNGERVRRSNRSL